MSFARDAFNRYLKENEIRYSRQREHILDVFLKAERHVTALELYELVRDKHPTIGYATVYRAIKVICHAGIAEEISFGEGVMRYEHKYGHEHHDHLVCTNCGKFVEVMNLQIEKLQEKLALEHGFKISSHKLQIFGICKNCRKA